MTDKYIPMSVEVCLAREVDHRKHKAVAFSVSNTDTQWFYFTQTATDGETVCFEELYGGKPVVRAKCLAHRMVFALLSYSGQPAEEVA